MQIAPTTEAHTDESAVDQPTQAQTLPADQFTQDDLTNAASSTADAHTIALTTQAKPTGIAAGLEALGLDGKLLAAQIVNFIILLLILRKFLYKPLVGMLEKRRETIESGMNKAEEIEKRYADFQVDHAKRIEESKAESASMIEQAKQAAEAMRQDTLAKTQAESEALLARAKDEIDRSKEKMLQELKQEVGSLVITLTSKVIGKTLGKDEQDKLVKEAMSEVNK